ncbi:MAG: nucleoside hydrolase [Marivibrio sp.]|uniref:nucleoside hydrolase n=1 Tax=Marivibrio sp. TaxID=2039719 RepID=UPI0032EAE6A9
MRRSILIDCDPGLDDAAAILTALGAADRLSLGAVTTVAGNVDLDAVTRNAAGLLALAGRTDVPLHAGCPRALFGAGERAGHVHGADGIGGVALSPGPAPSPEHAVQAIRRLARGGGVTIVAIGPLTNLALALVEEPAIATEIERLVIMGGVADGPGNVTDWAEFNFACDPEAARIVLESGLPTALFGLDVTRQAHVTPQRIAAFDALGTPAGKALARMLRAYQGERPRPVLHDPCTIAWLLQPDLFAGRRVRASVETANPAQRGRLMTTDDPQGPIELMTALDADGFFALLTQCVGGLRG